MPVGERIALAKQAWNIAARRLTAQGLAPLPRILSALDISRATWYYYGRQKVEADRKREEEDQKTLALITQVLQEHPRYGYRRIQEELKRKGMRVNGKRIRRLLNDFHLALKRGLRVTRSVACNPNPTLS
ncbi:IS3 family transposase [Thermus caldilimi]|uniref:IS3 family transposase n=1 Tax=Thermus caldilimi TaxID=2483360 RepID=UPI00107660E6|nr:IS3 family transposase [Thermus caldilimi]